MQTTAACATCQHQKLEEIEAGMRQSRTLAQLSKEFGLTKSSLQRHRAKHLATPGSPSDSAVTPLGSTLEETQRVLTRLLPALEKAIKDGRHSSAAQLSNSVLRSLDVLAKLKGEFGKSERESDADAKRIAWSTVLQTLTVNQLEAMLEKDFVALTPTQIDCLLLLASSVGLKCGVDVPTREELDDAFDRAHDEARHADSFRRNTGETRASVFAAAQAVSSRIEG